jgi:hypothetical protein
LASHYRISLAETKRIPYARPHYPLAPETSPLSEPDPNSLNELIESRIDDMFNKPSLKITDADLKVMVEYYQKERLRFKIESDQKDQKPKGTRSKRAPTSVADAIAGTADML